MRSPLASLLDPVWRSAVMVDEPVVFIAPGEGQADVDATRAVTGPDVAVRLLFSPDSEVTVTDASGEFLFVEGRDFTIDHAGRRLLRPAGSRLPLTSPDGLAVDDVRAVDRRVSLVSYTHRGDRWDGPVPPDARIVLPRLRGRLARGLPVAIAVLGDSISEGYDASGFRSVAPHQPPWTQLVAEGLQRRHAGVVTVRNFAVAGSTTADGRWLAADAARHLPDLVCIAFGMNDACYIEAGDFVAHVSDILARIAEVSPESECVLITPMRPTAACGWVDHRRFAAYREALLGVVRRGVAIADVMMLWDAVLTRKHEQDLSGNGSNHPNDFGHRLYAQTVLATLGVTGL